MPNYSNILNPLNIHGFGRSGTTLLQNIFAQAQFIQVCNETEGLVFCCYRGGSLLNPSHDKSIFYALGDRTPAIKCVHESLIASMPSKKTAWCQKIGGIPNFVVWENIICKSDDEYSCKPYNFPYAWYWEVINNSFPLSKNILIIRNYRDVIISRMHHSNFVPIDIASDLAVYYNILGHPDSKIDVIVEYENLINNSEFCINTLCQSIGINYNKNMLRAFDYLASAGPDRDLVTVRKTGFSRSEEYSKYITQEIVDLVEPALCLLKKRHESLMS